MVSKTPEPPTPALAPLFVIHAEAEESFVHDLLLPALGLSAKDVRLSSRLPLGEPILQSLERNVAECRATLVVVSHAATMAPWAQFATILAGHAAVEGEARVIPILLEEGAADGWLRARVSVDLIKPEKRAPALAELARHLGALGEAQEARLECPYPGMRSLGAEDGALLFGRDGDIAKITAALFADQRELVLVGASGSGKSSLVRAGVLPRLAKGRWPEVVVRELRPGPHPMQRLEAALACDAESERRGEPEWNARAAKLLSTHGKAARLVVVIDQLEEVFALAEPDQRAAFFAALIALREDPRCHLIFCLRADFFGKLIESALWRGRELSHLVIEPLAGEPLRQAIVLPARQAGVYLEPPLVERLLKEADASEHSLPLLQAALLQLWDERERRVLSLAAYQRVCGGQKSGLGAAMSRHADACLAELSAAQRKIARRVLLRLVSFGEGAEDSRWARPRAELTADGESDLELEAVLEHLTQARLVVRDRGGDAGEERVDLAHEALLSSWQRLAEWIGELRADGQRLRRHEHAAAGWALRGRGTGGLLDGRELSESGQWRKSEPARELGESADLTAFFDASARAQKSRERRDGAAALAFAGLAVFAVLAFFVARGAVARRDQADQGRGIAVAQRQRSEGQRLRAAARAALAAELPQRALPLLVRARQLEGSAPPDFALAMMFREATRGVLVARQLHASDLSAIALSPDGAQFVSATVDGALQLWRTSDGAAVSEPLHHARGTVTGVAYFPDGQRLVSCGEDGSARVWDVQGRSTGLVLHHGAPLRVVKVSPDGRYVLTGGADGRAIVWNASSGAPVGRPLVHRAAVGAASFSRDSSLVATASDDHSARVWRVRDGQPISNPLPHEDNLVSIEIAPDNERLLTANADKGAKVWQLRAGAVVFSLSAPMGLASAEYSPDGAQILTAADNKWARRWSARDGSPLGAQMSHGAGVNEARYSGDGDRIVTASNDKTARVWESATGRSLTQPLQHDGSVLFVAVNREGTLVITASADRHTYVWKINVPPAELATFVHDGTINGMAFSRDGVWLATASADKTVQLRSADTGELILKLSRGREVFHVAISPDGQLVATAEGKVVRLWLLTGELAQEIEHESNVRGLAFDRSGAVLFSVEKGGGLRATEVRDGSERFRASLSKKVSCMALSPDGTKLAVGTEHGDIRLWDATLQRQLSVPFNHLQEVESLQFSEDGALLLSASKDGKAKVWSLKELKALVVLDHEQPVDSARWSPDGRWIATASRRFAILWDAKSGQEIVRRNLSEWIGSVEWSPDGRWLAMGGTQDRVERWITNDSTGSLEEWREIAATGAFTLDAEGQVQSAPAQPVRLALQCSIESRHAIGSQPSDSIGEAWPPSMLTLSSSASRSTCTSGSCCTSRTPRTWRRR